MQEKHKKLSNYELVGRLIEELKLRKYSYRTLFDIFNNTKIVLFHQ